MQGRAGSLELALLSGNCRCFSFFGLAVRSSSAVRNRCDDRLHDNGVLMRLVCLAHGVTQPLYIEDLFRMQRCRGVVRAGAQHGQATDYFFRRLRAQSCHSRVQMIPDGVNRHVADWSNGAGYRFVCVVVIRRSLDSIGDNYNCQKT